MSEPNQKPIKKRQRNVEQASKKRKRFALEPGLKGFLCSCNFQEKSCIREAYNLLNEYGDVMYGTEGNKGESAEDILNAEEDIEGLLNEIRAMQSVEKEAGRRFQVLDSGAKNFLFVKSTVEDPVALAEMIMKDVFEKGKTKTRSLIRLIPVEATCKAYMYDIRKTALPLIEKYFKDAPKSFSIVYNHRNNNSISKAEVIATLADLVTSTRTDHTVDLKNAEVSVIVEVIKSICLLAVVPRYFKYKKYNLDSLAVKKITQFGPAPKSPEPVTAPTNPNK